MKKIAALTLLILLYSAFPVSQERGFKVMARTSSGEMINLYKECHALVIGISTYLYGWPDLPNAVRDADSIGDMLTKLGFEVVKLMNPANSELRQALDTFVFGPGQNKDNCVVIFFAGHGHTEKLTYGVDMGYVVPKDAPLPERDRSGFMQKAIDMQTIESYARRIEAKHALFLFDSCFSGAIFDMVRAVPADIQYRTAQPVRQFITAGSAEESVPDRSIFKDQFLEGLQGEADRNKDGYVTGTELGEFLQEKVVNYSKGSQHPQYGKIRDSKLDKGDFVFPLESKLAENVALSEPLKTGIALVPKYGSLEINVDVEGARIYQDGEFKGTTKEGYSFVLDPLISGTRIIRISHDDYKEYAAPVNISEGQRAKMTAQLTPVSSSEKYNFNIATSPENAKIIIDSVERGRTPFQLKIKEGRYTLRIEKEGFRPREEKIEVSSDVLKRYDLEKLGFGFLIISFHPFAEVEIDGRQYGEVPPPLEVRLAEGKHIVKFTYSSFKKEKTIEVDLLKDERKRIHEKSEFWNIKIEDKTKG